MSNDDKILIIAWWSIENVQNKSSYDIYISIIVIPTKLLDVCDFEGCEI